MPDMLEIRCFMEIQNYHWIKWWMLSAILQHPQKSENFTK